MHLRQGVFVARDLEASTAALCDVLGIEVAYRDPNVGRWGLANIVAPAGEDFLEIVSPTREGTSAGRYLDRRKGDGAYMIILQVADAGAERRRVKALGIRAVEEKNAGDYVYTHFHPSDLGGFLLSLDSTTAPPGDTGKVWWPPAGPDWRRHAGKGRIAGIAGIELQGADPVGMAEQWSRVLGRPAARHGAGFAIALDGAELRIVAAEDGRGPGISAYDLRCTDRAGIMDAAGRRGLVRGPAQIELCGCRINLS